MDSDVHPDPIRRWANRRRMAWCGFWAGVAYPVASVLVALALPEQSYEVTLDFFAALAVPFYALIVGVPVGFYITGTTFETVSINKINQNK